MTTLSDKSIRSMCLNGLISPFHLQQLQPASYDLILGQIGKTSLKEYELQPREFILCSTNERVDLPANIVGRLEGKSSWARKGLIVHTAGFVDPGFSGTLTLEMSNLSDVPILLKWGERICQIAFQWLNESAERPYGHPEIGSHYQGQTGTVESALP